MGQTAKREIPVEHWVLVLSLSHWNPKVLFVVLKASHFSEQEFRIPTKILQRFSKYCIFSFDYHVFHSYRLLTASCFSLASLLCRRQSIATTKGGFIFDRPCAGSCNCVLENVTCLCVCSPGHSFWRDHGSGGAGAWDGDSAHCECCCAGSGCPGHIPLLQHVSLVRGGGWCLFKLKFLRAVLSC